MIRSLDHLVLTTADEAACIHFYTEVLGMRLESFAAAPRRSSGAPSSSARRRSTCM